MARRWGRAGRPRRASLCGPGLSREGLGSRRPRRYADTPPVARANTPAVPERSRLFVHRQAPQLQAAVHGISAARAFTAAGANAAEPSRGLAESGAYGRDSFTGGLEEEPTQEAPGGSAAEDGRAQYGGTQAGACTRSHRPSPVLRLRSCRIDSRVPTACVLHCSPAHSVGCSRRATTTRYNLALTLDRAVVCPAAVDDWSPSRWLSTGQDEPPLPQYDSGGQLGRTMTMAREHGVFGGGSDLANSPASPEPGIGSLGEAAAGGWRSSNPMAVDAGSTPGPAAWKKGAHDGLGMGMESSGGGGGGGALAGDGGAAGIAETAGQLSHVEAVLQRARNRRLQGAS